MYPLGWGTFCYRRVPLAGVLGMRFTAFPPASRRVSVAFAAGSFFGSRSRRFRLFVLSIWRLALVLLAQNGFALCLVSRVYRTATTLLNWLRFRGVRKMSQKVRNARRLPTEFKKRSAFTRWRKYPGIPGSLSIPRFEGPKRLPPQSLRHPKGGLTNQKNCYPI